MPSIDSIAGMGVRQATRMRKARIRTTEALLKRGKTRAGRRRIAADTGLAEELIVTWVNRADLMRVKGIGSEYSDLLEASGVETVRELKTRNPTNLHRKMVKVNDQKRLVRRLPTESMVESWIANASRLTSVIKY
jgi:predicted RecB family nuclease